jgi:cold shock CspA family protein
MPLQFHRVVDEMKIWGASSGVERAGLGSLNEGDKMSYEVVSNRGKESAENLRVG